MPDALTPTEDELEIMQVCTGYRTEAEMNRAGGLNPRDQKWKDNLDLYWNRFDFSDRANWQAQETMPEVPAFVDRFAAAMKEALVASYDGFYTVVDPADPEGNLARPIKKLTDMWLGRCATMANGQPSSFPAVFEEQMKMGALMACCGSVTWRKEKGGGRVAFETVDPRFVWFDHTMRNLYRIRRIEVDAHELGRFVKMKDNQGNPLFREADIARLQNEMKYNSQEYNRERTGAAEEVLSTRKTVTIDEYLATVVNQAGEVLAEDALIMMVDDKYMLRGPEKNPFWHGQDWMVFCPLVTVPLSPYGRSYMEDFGSLAVVFNNLTNLILDAVYTSALNVFAVMPSALLNPEQIAEGVWPGKTLLLEDGYTADQVAKGIEMGRLDPGAVQVWQAMKNELHEAAAVNELGLGQFAPNSRTSATEISAAQSNSGAVVRSMAQTVEARFLNLVLDLMWKTGLQHMPPEDPRIIQAIGPEMNRVIYGQRKALIQHPFTFQARGLSMLIQKSQMLRSLMGVMQIIGANEAMAAAFLQKVDFDKLINLLFVLSNVDPSDISKSERQLAIQQVAGPLQQAAGGATASPRASSEVGSLAGQLGVAL